MWKKEKVRFGDLDANAPFYLDEQMCGANIEGWPHYPCEDFDDDDMVWTLYEPHLDENPWIVSKEEADLRHRTRDYGLSKGQIHRLFFSGYTKIVKVHGEVGASELGMHMGIVRNHGVVAFVRPEDEHQIYAYVLLDSGKIVDGSFHLFGDGTFSLS